jgi:hypothetical protein
VRVVANSLWQPELMILFAIVCDESIHDNNCITAALHVINDFTILQIKYFPVYIQCIMLVCNYM